MFVSRNKSKALTREVQCWNERTFAGTLVILNVRKSSISSADSVLVLHYRWRAYNLIESELKTELHA
jgi:hypothetical protein